MKKLLTTILLISMLAALTACGDKSDNKASDNKGGNTPNENSSVVANPDNLNNEKLELNEEAEETKKEETKEEIKETEKEETKKPSGNKTPSQSTSEDKKPAEDKKPQAQEPAKDATLGETLLSAFKAQASAGKSTLEIAEALAQNEAITFSSGAMSVEEGLLSGFDNAEITGFKSGATFAPMIGSIAFVGYVFELEDGADSASFISNLRKNANLRWNICVEAEEMVTGSAGNKVFFVMCPKSLEN